MTAPTPAGQARADRGEADLIERVARALHWAACEDRCGRGPTDVHRRQAAAAVEVLRGEGR